MRLPTSELAYMFGEGEMRRNIVALLRYGLFLAAVVLLFASVFQLIMVEVEGQSHDCIVRMILRRRSTLSTYRHRIG